MCSRNVSGPQAHSLEMNLQTIQSRYHFSLDLYLKSQPGSAESSHLWEECCTWCFIAHADDQAVRTFFSL